MSIEPLGFIVLLLGLVGLASRPAFLIYVFTVATLLGAAAAVTLPSLGSANILPAYLLLGFLTVSVFFRHEFLANAGSALEFPRAGFWLLATAVYGTVTALFFPRIFAGATYVFGIARTELGPGITLTPLGPSSGNVTQTVYFIGDFACFLVFYAYASTARGVAVIARAVLAAAAVNLAFAVLDLVTYWTGTTTYLAFLHDATYTLLDEVALGGFKRISGSFSEASGFGYATLGWVAYCTILWLRGVYPRLTGALALLSLTALLFSTSATGYVGLGGFAVALLCASLGGLLVGPVSRNTLSFILAAPVLAAALIIGLRLNEPVWTVVDQLVEQTVITKPFSASGIERARWNRQAMTNFTDTDGVGAGIGSIRASSFPVAVLGNIGVVGAITYGCFIVGVLFGKKRRWGSYPLSAFQGAARWACFAQIVAACASASTIDLNLPFFLLAGLACAGPAADTSARRAPAPRAEFGVAQSPTGPPLTDNPVG